MVSPLMEFPADPAWTGLWEFLFEDEKSPWFRFFLKRNSMFFRIDGFIGTPVINHAAFRKFVFRLLRDKSSDGRLMGQGGKYWVIEDTGASFTMDTPNGVSAEKEINEKRFRVCDRF